MTKLTTRRRMLTAAAALAAAPAIAGATSAFGAERSGSAIGRLWAEAENLRTKLAALRLHGDGALSDDIPGWMRMAGAPNGIGHRRYEAIVSILKAEPASSHDLAIMAQAALDADMLNGPRSWAQQRFAEASLAFTTKAVG